MFLRFQQERAKKAKRTKFNLDSAETPVLTHKGQILGSSIAQDGWSESSDDENLGKDVVQNLHFGGGFLPAHQSNEPLQHKHRADILQEIVMKSKLHKLEKKEAKNVQEDQRELLDKAYAELLHSSSLEFKPTRRDRSEEVGPDDADEYDKSLRVMAFESRVKPSDRTLTKEEIALAEYQKLAQLEHERLQRMKPDFHPEKREAVMNDDCIDDLAFPTELSNPSSEDLSESEDVSTVDNSHTDDESVGDGDIDNADDSDDEEQNVASDELVQVSLTHDFVSSKEIMPHSIECPLHFKDFRHLVDLYVSNAEQFSTLVDRILTWNSIYLPGVKLENEKKMTTFFDILMNYFISLGDSLQLSIQTKEVFFMVRAFFSKISDHF